MSRAATGQRTVVLVGAGLIGTSIALDLTEAGHRVHLVDRYASHARVAASLGAGLVTRPEPDEVDLVVVAVPPRALAPVVAQSLVRYPNAVVTDVGSVKSAVLAALQELESDLRRYVGSHPMAGSQNSGPLAARTGMFEDRTWVVTPHDEALPSAVDAVTDLALTCRARVVVLDAREHDVAVAQVSHLPQLMSSLTAGRLTEVPAGHLKLAGQGVRDVTRVAGSDPVLWQQIVAANAGALRTELAAVHAALGGLLESLDDPSAVKAFLARGVEGTKVLPGKHGLATTHYAHVVVEIPDTPGALARLFAEVEGAGVNVEDVSIEHDETRQVGYLSIAVAPDRAAGLTETMTRGGWNLRA